MGELEKVWDAEPLKDFTNRYQRDVNRNSGIALDNGTNQFKTVENTSGVAMPEDSEGLSTRLKTMGVDPNCSILASASYEVFGR